MVSVVRTSLRLKSNFPSSLLRVAAHFSSSSANRQDAKRGLLERLANGPVIGDGSFVITLEKRGYVEAGAWTPEAVLQYPEAVKQLHREFLRAGSDVMQTFTFYSSDDKLCLSGDNLDKTETINCENLNNVACDLAKEVASEGDALVAGGISPVPGYVEEKGKEFVMAEFNKQMKVFTKMRGPKKHLKRLAAPKHWMLDKLSGTFAPRPSQGPHKLRECLPLVIFLRNRLKYALTGDEVKKITMQRLIKVDGKVRTDINFPAGFMDVISIERTNENFRLIYDVKGRFIVHRITSEEGKYKLCKVRKIWTGSKGVPQLSTHDARTIRYPDPAIKANDTVKVDIATGKITDYIKFESGNLCMITGGRNLGRVGVLTHRERHPGSFDICHVRDTQNHTFSTRLTNVFVIGKGQKPYISLPRGKGIRLSIMEEREKRLAQKQ